MEVPQNGGGQADGFLWSFAPIIPPGGSYALYIPIASSAATFAPGNFEIMQTPKLVPEPTPLMLFGLGVSLVGIGWMKKRKTAML